MAGAHFRQAASARKPASCEFSPLVQTGLPAILSHGAHCI